MLAEAIEWVRYLMLLKWPYATDLYLISLVTSGHVNARGGKPRYDLMVALVTLVVRTWPCMVKRSLFGFGV